MRILMIAEYFPSMGPGGPEITGGIEAHCYYIARELSKDHQVTVIASHVVGTAREETIEGIRVLRCGSTRGYSQSGSFWGRLTFMKSAFSTGLTIPADIVEGCSWIAYVPAFQVGNKRGLPTVAFYADVLIGEWVKLVGLGGLFMELLERYVLRKPWSVISAISESTKRKLVAAGVNPARIVVKAPGGVDVHRIEGIQATKAEEPTISCVARLVAYKRVDVLIRAVALLKRRIPTLRCRILGNGPCEEALRKLASDLGVRENVEFIGAGLPHDDVYRIVKSSTVFCLPSTVEGFGQVVAEAMACGTPYVCSNIPAIRDVTQNGVGGLLFEPGDARALAECLWKLLSDTEFYDASSEAGHELARRYDYHIVARQTIELYQSLCDDIRKQ